MSSKGQKSPQSVKATIQDKDRKAYNALLEAAGHPTVDFENVSQEEKRIFDNKVWQWVKAGKPKAKLPEIANKEVSITMLVREKSLGKQYLWFRTDDEQEIGREKTFEYPKQEVIDNKGIPTGDVVEDTSKDPIKEYDKFTIPYTDKKASELVLKAIESSVEPKFVFRKGRIIAQMEDSQHFLESDFDQIIKTTKIPQVR